MEKKELTAADVWAMFAETARRQEETDRQMKETERQMKENERKFKELREEERKEAEQLTKEWREDRKETERLIKDLTKNISGISDSNGRFAEEYFYNSLLEKLEFAGIEFDSISTGPAFKRAKKGPEGRKMEGQFDIVMENCSSIAIIEIKYKAKSEDVEDLATRKVENFRALFPEYKSFDIYLGLGSLSFDNYVVNKAREYGIGLLKQLGETIEYETGWVRAH